MRLGLGQTLSRWFAKLAEFLPSDISGLGLWLDATDETTLNTKMAADFTAASSQYLSSSSSGLNPNGTTDFSIGCWVKVDSLTLNMGIMGQYDGVTTGKFYLGTSTGGNKIAFKIQEADATTTAINSTTTISAGPWYFAVAVYDYTNSLLKITVNGEAFATTPITDPHDSNTIDFWMGRQTTSYLDGTVDGAFFYNKALSLSDIQSLYAEGVGIKYSSAISLDGTTKAVSQAFATDDALDIDGIITPLAATTVGTWAAWVKPTDATPAGTDAIIGFGEANADTYLLLNIEITSGALKMQATNGSTNQWRMQTDANPFSDGVWCHVALVQDGVSPVLYVNGVAVSQTFDVTTDKTFWFSQMSGIDTARIGALNYNSGVNSLFFNGSIDEVAVWDRVVTPTELLAIKDLAIGSWTTAHKVDLVSHYAMNDDGAQTDSIGAHNGSLISVPTYDVGNVDDTTITTGTSMVSWWELNEQSGIRFDAHASNNLTDNNTVGYALGHIQEPIGETKTVAQTSAANAEYLSSTNEALNPTGDFSFGMWVNNSNVTTSVIASNWGSSKGWQILRAGVGGDDFVFYFYGDSGLKSTSSVKGLVDVWNYIFFTHDLSAKTFSFSVNGGAFVTQTYTTSYDDIAVCDFNISGRSSGALRNTALESNAIFYDKALDITQVNALYDLRLFSDYTDLTVDMLTSLTAFWNLDEASGNRLDSSGNGYTLTDNATVTSVDYTAGYVWRWTDKSANVYNFDQDTAAKQPQYISNGFGTESTAHLDFDGVDDFLVNTDKTASSVGTLFLVVNCVTSVSRNWVYNDSTSGTNSISISGETQPAFRMWTDSANYIHALLPAPLVDNTHYLVTVDFDGAEDSHAWNNGGNYDTNVVSANPVTSGVGAILGSRLTTGNNIADMKLAEVIRYDGVLSDDDRALIETYLNTKHGIY